MSVRACVRSTRGRAGVARSAVSRDGYRGPTREKKKTAGDGATRAEKKAGKNYFGGSDGAGEQKNDLGGSEKKILFGRERKKILTSTRTQPTKDFYVQ